VAASRHVGSDGDVPFVDPEVIPVRVLVTNDDGIDSPGLTTLAVMAADAGHDVVVAAPARESSGASASLVGAQQGGRRILAPK
jgi:5'-nucleotidase